MLDDSQDRKLVNELETFHWKLEKTTHQIAHESILGVHDAFSGYWITG